MSRFPTPPHDILPQPPPTHQSPDLFFPHQHHQWPRPLFPKDLCLAMFPAPWKHILSSGSYSQRKGQTLSKGTHDPPKKALTPTRVSLQSSIIVQPTATIPPWAPLQALPILENSSHARQGTGEGTVQSHKTSLYGPPTLLAQEPITMNHRPPPSFQRQSPEPVPLTSSSPCSQFFSSLQICCSRHHRLPTAGATSTQPGRPRPSDSQTSLPSSDSPT